MDDELVLTDPPEDGAEALPAVATQGVEVGVLVADIDAVQRVVGLVEGEPEVFERAIAQFGTAWIRAPALGEGQQRVEARRVVVRLPPGDMPAGSQVPPPDQRTPPHLAQIGAPVDPGGVQELHAPLWRDRPLSGRRSPHKARSLAARLLGHLADSQRLAQLPALASRGLKAMAEPLVVAQGPEGPELTADAPGLLQRGVLQSVTQLLGRWIGRRLGRRVVGWLRGVVGVDHLRVGALVAVERRRQQRIALEHGLRLTGQDAHEHAGAKSRLEDLGPADADRVVGSEGLHPEREPLEPVVGARRHPLHAVGRPQPRQHVVGVQFAGREVPNVCRRVVRTLLFGLEPLVVGGERIAGAPAGPARVDVG